MNTKDSGHFNAYIILAICTGNGVRGRRVPFLSHSQFENKLFFSCFFFFFHHWFACNQMKTLPHNKSTYLTCGLKLGSSDPVMRLSVGLHECGELGNRLVWRETVGDRGKQKHPS